VEMESPVSGKVLELAGVVGDQVPIGSVLAVIETEVADRATETAEDSNDERPLADGTVEATPEMAAAMPIVAATTKPKSAPQESFVPSEVEGPAPDERVSTSLDTKGSHSHVLASPAVRQRARDLGVDLAQVRTSSDRIRHSDLDAYLL